MTDQALVALVSDHHGPLHKTPKTALVIFPSEIESKQGKVYQVKFARPKK